ncbi:MAK10-like protein [Tanacetum coccineum]
MGDENPICTLGDYSKPSHEGYKKTISYPVEETVRGTLLRFDTIRIGANWMLISGTSVRGIQNKTSGFPKTSSNWLERLPAGSITKWEDLTSLFLAQFFPPGRIVKLRNDISIRTIDQSAGGKLRDRNAEESWALLEDCLYDNQSWNDPRDFAKLVKAIALPQDVPTTFDRRLIKLENQVRDFEPFDTLADLGSCVNIIRLYLFKKLNIRLLEETDHVFRLADGTKSYPVGIVKDVEVHIGKLKLLNDFYMIDMKKDPETPLLVGRGFLATINAVIDCRMAKIAVGEGITRSESEDLIKNPINWDKPPKNRDGARHTKIKLIDPDGEEFTKTLQSIPTSRKLSERESPKEIINLDHFYDT